MALLYSNENFPKPVVDELRGLGHDVMTVLEAGKADQGIPDDEVLSFAVSLGRAVLTINRRHFIKLHQQHPNHAGIVICTLDTDFHGQALRIDSEVKQHEPIAGKLLRVNRPR